MRLTKNDALTLELRTKTSLRQGRVTPVQYPAAYRFARLAIKALAGAGFKKEAQSILTIIQNKSI